MKVLITGKTGVGKTTILKRLNFKNTLFVDELVKDVFYKNGHFVFKKIVEKHGTAVVENGFINTKILGKKVLTDLNELRNLSLLVIPFVREYIRSLNGNWLIEMAAYIEYESDFEDIFDKVVVITRNEEFVLNKFAYVGTDNINLISDAKIRHDSLVENNASIDDAVASLKLLVNGFFDD